MLNIFILKTPVVFFNQKNHYSADLKLRLRNINLLLFTIGTD